MKIVTATYNAETQVLAVTYNGETREFKAHTIHGERATAYNVMAGKFRSGAKLWPCCVTLWFKSGNAVVEQGGFSNRGGAQQIVGWWNNDSNNNSKHNGAR